MATQTGGNVDLKLLDLQNDIVKNLINYINENSNILSQTISQDKHNIEVIKQRINNLINSGVGEWSEIIDARRGFTNLTDSINRASVGYYPYDPPTDKAEYSFWINSVNKKAYMLLSDSPITWVQIGQQDVIDKFMDLLYNKANIEVNLGTDLNKHVESLDCTWTNGVEVEKIEGQFIQNLIDTRKCIYRMSGDTRSPIPTDITDSSMKVISNSNSFIGTGCFIGVTSGKEYTIKCSSVDDLDVHVYNADGLTSSNRNDKRITSQHSQNIDIKFTAPLSNYVFIAFIKHGSDTNGTVVTNPICIEGDYTNKPLEWVKGTQPSIPQVNIVGENLFDGIMEIGFIGSDGQDSSTTTTGSRTINYIDVEPNTSYTISYDKGASNATYIYEYDINKKFIKTSQSGASTSTRNVARVTTDSSTRYIRFRTSTNFVGLIQNGTFNEGDSYTYKPHKQSQFKLNDWIGDNEIYENGLINKSWDRILLSEAYGNLESSLTKTNTYRFQIILDENYYGTTSSSNIYPEIYFKDFKNIVNDTLDIKHLYQAIKTDGSEVVILFIPKAELDGLSGTTLNDKFINWMKQNDDYVYYKKANSININPSIEGLITSYGEENNTISISEDIKNCKLSIKENLNNGLSQTTENYSQTNGNKLIELEDKLQYTSKDKQNKDEEGYFEIIEERRNDGSLLTKSTLKNKVDELYRERQVQIYDRYGKIIREIVFELTYDSDGSLMDENIVSDSNKNI